MQAKRQQCALKAANDEAERLRVTSEGLKSRVAALEQACQEAKDRLAAADEQVRETRPLGLGLGSALRVM